VYDFNESCLKTEEKYGNTSVRLEKPVSQSKVEKHQSFANTHIESIRTVHLLTARRRKCVMFSVCVVAELSVTVTSSKCQQATRYRQRTAPDTTTMPRVSCITSIPYKFTALGGDGQLQASDQIYLRSKLSEKQEGSCC